MTAKEACDFANTEFQDYSAETDNAVHEFLQSASASDIQAFILCIGVNTRRRWLDIARTSLDARVGQDAERTAQKLITGTDTLIVETKSLVKLTHRLYILTFVLIFLGAFEVIKFILGLFCHSVE